MAAVQREHLFIFVPPQGFASFIYVCDWDSRNPTATLSLYYITIKVTTKNKREPERIKLVK